MRKNHRMLPLTSSLLLPLSMGRGKFASYIVETALILLGKHKALMKSDKSLDGLGYQDTHDVICLLEDFLDRMTRLERAAFPEDFPKKMCF